MIETWAVILAAGEGKRMRSTRAKVLHTLGGRPLVAYPVELARAVGARGIVVVIGHQGEAVRETLAGDDALRFVEQRPQRRRFRFVGGADVVNVTIFREHLVDFDELGVRHAGGEIHSGLLESLDDQFCFFQSHALLRNSDLIG